MSSIALRLRSAHALRYAGAVPAIGAEQPPARLFNRNFVLLCQAQLVSQFGSQAFVVALTFWTAEATRSATMSGLMMMASILPLVVLAPLTGTFVDRRRSRLRIIVGCDLLSGACAVLLAAGFVAGPDVWRPAMLFAAALLIGICNAFFDPALNAFASDLVPPRQIEAANAFRQGSRQITVLGAQGIGGMLYAALGPAALFLLNGVSFLMAGASEMLIRTPPGEPAVPRDSDGVPARKTFLSEAAEGFRYIAAQPGMIEVFTIASVFNALLMPISVLLPVYATTYLHADVSWYGLLLASIGGGAIAGPALIGAAWSRLDGASRRRILVGSYAGLAAALAVLGQIRSLSAALLILFTTGVLAGMINVLMLSILQRRTAAEFRGRVISLHTMMTRVLVPLGLVGGGAMADLMGRNVPLVYGIAGGLALATVVVLTSRPSARAYLASS